MNVSNSSPRSGRRPELGLGRGTVQLAPGYTPNPDLSPEEQFLTAAMAGRNCFLTGMGGTGKSHTLKRFIELKASVATRFIGEAPGIDVVAPTGVAAVNVGGQTIHRWAGINLGPKGGEDWDDFFASNLRKKMESDYRLGPGYRIRQCKVLVIDEISMLPGELLNFLDWLFRRVRCQDTKPFGGVQVIGVGDFLQLPPVRTDSNIPYDWAFKSDSWRDAQLAPFNLVTCHRQNEQDFISALADFRMGRINGSTAATLQPRVQAFVPNHVPRLCTHNTQVDRWNSAQLESLDGDLFTFKALKSGDCRELEYLTRNLVTPEVLGLKLGAHVMFTVNRADEHYNGQVGKVVELNGNSITVRTGNRDIAVEPFTWKFEQKRPDSATFTQYPLRLSYAMTIHRAQGITLDAAHIDIRAAREPGQAYVALSRVRTLAGLTLKDWISGAWVSNDAINFYKEMK